MTKKELETELKLKQAQIKSLSVQLAKLKGRNAKGQFKRKSA